MTISPINQDQTPEVDSSPGVDPTLDPKFGRNTSILIICALLLQETVNTSIQSTIQDGKAVDQQSVLMQNLNQKERNMDNFKLVFENDHWVTWQTRQFHANKYGPGGWWSTHTHREFVQSNKATAARCQVQLKQYNAEREQIAGVFGEAQTAAQSPMTQLNSDSNEIQQEQQQGLGILIQFQQLTFAALQRRQV